MLVARRDPPLHSGEYDGSRAHGHGHSSRFMTALQVVGSLLAIPVGLASAYSIYHTNFTAEARCESLRGNIVSMLDKSADASTLRMLVRRDVAAFESTCGAVDPDAVAAFKKLLTAKAAAPAPVAAPVHQPPAVVEQPQQAAHEPVQQPVETVKQVAPPKAAPAPVAAEAKPVEAKPIHRDAATSDAHWIDSVREALTHAPAAHEDAVEAPAPAPAPPAVAQPAVQPPPAVQLTPPPPPPAPPPRVVHEAPPAPPVSLAAPAAPALPEPVPVAAAPAPAPAADHPVPPGSIPDAQPAEKPAETSGHSWMSQVPILNRVVGN